MEEDAAGPTLLSPSRIAAARLLRASGRAGPVRLVWRPTASRARPRPTVITALNVSWESNRVTAAWPTARPRPQATTVPNTKPLRNAIPFVRGRALRTTTSVAVSTRKLAAAASA